VRDLPISAQGLPAYGGFTRHPFGGFTRRYFYPPSLWRNGGLF